MSIFPTKILLATDGSKDADLALSTAVDIANSTNSELHIVTAAPGRPDPAYGSHELASVGKPTRKRSKRSRRMLRTYLMSS